MKDDLEVKSTKANTEFSQQVGDIAKRKLKAQRHVTKTVWSGLGMMGLIGWSVAAPTLIGVAIGYWLDTNYTGSHSWSLALLSVGLVIGCVNAWHWVIKEDEAMHNPEDSNGDE